MLNVYKLGCAATTAGDNMNSVQLPRKGIIKQILINLLIVLETDSYATVQVRKNVSVGTFQTAQSSPTGVLAEACQTALMTTSGMSNAGSCVRVDCYEPCSERDTLYLHGSGSGSNQCTANVLIFVEEP